LACNFGAHAAPEVRRTLFLTRLQSFQIHQVDLTAITAQGKRIR
jgi:hypothetical protein